MKRSRLGKKCKLDISKARLKNLYWKDNLSSYQIAKKFGCSKIPVLRLMDTYNIKRRPSGGGFRKIFITKKKLYDLYWNKKLSAFEIAKKYDCSGTTILKLMKEYNIQRRFFKTPIKFIIPKKKLVYLYLKRGLTIEQVAKKFGCSITPIRDSMERYGIKARPLAPYLPKRFKKNTYAYNYILGVLLGDGSVHRGTFKLEVIDKDFRNKFAEQGKKLGFNVKSHVYDRYYANIYNKRLVEILRKDRLNPKITRGFVNGFVDSEGSVNFDKKHGSRRINIYNKNRKVLRKIRDFLFSKNIETTIRPMRKIKNPVYTLNINNRKSLINFHKHFKFSIKRKQDKLNAIIKSYKK